MGTEFCTLGSCASKVMRSLTPMSYSSWSIWAQSRDSLPARRCCLPSYSMGMTTVMRSGLQLAAHMMRLRSAKCSSGVIGISLPKKLYVTPWLATSQMTKRSLPRSVSITMPLPSPLVKRGQAESMMNVSFFRDPSTSTDLYHSTRLLSTSSVSSRAPGVAMRARGPFGLAVLKVNLDVICVLRNFRFKYIKQTDEYQLLLT